MKCSKCGSDNVSAQVVSETKLKEKKHGIIWWFLLGWYWVPIKWLFFTIPALIIKIFKPTKYKSKTTHITKFVCQSCGKTWNA